MAQLEGIAREAQEVYTLREAKDFGMRNDLWIPYPRQSPHLLAEGRPVATAPEVSILISRDFHSPSLYELGLGAYFSEHARVDHSYFTGFIIESTQAEGVRLSPFQLKDGLYFAPLKTNPQNNDYEAEFDLQHTSRTTYYSFYLPTRPWPNQALRGEFFIQALYDSIGKLGVSQRNIVKNILELDALLYMDENPDLLPVEAREAIRAALASK